MKKWIHALRMDMFRCFCSPPIYLAVLASAAVMLTGVMQTILLFSDLNVLYLVVGQEFSVIPFVLCALPFATTFCADYRNRFIWYSVQRSSVPGYAWGKITCTAVCSGIAAALGIALFIAVLTARFPLIGYDSAFEARSSIAPYGELLLGSHPIAYFLCKLLCEAMFAAILATAALTISCFIPNIFVALVSPIICFYAAINAAPYGWLSPYRLFITTSVDMGGPARSMLYTFAYTVCCIGILGAIFLIRLKRRVEHG